MHFPSNASLNVLDVGNTQMVPRIQQIVNNVESIYKVLLLFGLPCTRVRGEATLA